MSDDDKIPLLANPAASTFARADSPPAPPMTYESLTAATEYLLRRFGVRRSWAPAGIGWCSMLRQTLVFETQGVMLLQPGDEYYPEQIEPDETRTVLKNRPPELFPDGVAGYRIQCRLWGIYR